MKIYVLTEVGEDIGFGHFTRCMALCQGFKEKALPAKMIANGYILAHDLLKDIDVEFFNWIENDELLLNLLVDSDIIIIDSYLADYQLYRKISNLKKTTVYFDDTQRMSYPPGIVLNCAVCAEKKSYQEREGFKKLLGCDFAPLRQDFWDVPSKVIKERMRDILITFGGACQASDVESLLGFLAGRFDGFTYHVVLGNKVCGDCDSKMCDDVKIYSNLTGSDMCRLMLACDVCISGGGQTTYELARVGVPTIGICLAENQRANLEAWSKKGFLSYVGWYNEKDLFNRIGGAIDKLIPVEERVKASQIGTGFIDGQGVKRIVDSILGLHREN